MKSNIIIKVIAGTAVLLVVFILIKSSNQNQEPEAIEANLSTIETGPSQVDNGLMQEKYTKEQLKNTFNVDVDSPVETMRTLTNEMLVMRESSEQLIEENKSLKHDIEKLLKMEDSINRRVNKNLVNAERKVELKQNQLESSQNDSQSLLKRLRRKVDSYIEDDKSGKSTASGYSISGAGIPSGLGYDDNGLPVDFSEMVWVSPVDYKVDPNNTSKITLPKLFNNVTEKVPLPGIKDERKDEKERLIKAYTIPQNATLIGAVSMTALLGRIPTGGSIQDPYPFKIIVGQENLSSNGIKIPNVTGIKMSGVASGDWTLSCASGKVYSMTFTFRDGTIRTIPTPTDKPAKETYPIAWLSDPNGIPCITGERITNAATYLSSRVGLSAASGYANALAQSELTRTVGDNGNSTATLTGSPTQFAKNTAISEGINDVTDWVDERQANSFDAIYVAPGTELAIHTNMELKIDYDPMGRKVDHYAKINRRSQHYID